MSSTTLDRPRGEMVEPMPQAIMLSASMSEQITTAEARQLIQRWEDSRSARPGDPRAEFFGREMLERILAQSSCVGIRIYHGRTEQGKHVVVLVGSDARGNNLTDIVAEEGLPCPPACGPFGDFPED